MARVFDIPEPAPSSCGLATGGFSVSGEFPDVDLANVSFCYYMKGWLTLIRKKPTGYTASYKMMKSSNRALLTDIAPSCRLDADFVVAFANLWVTWLKLARYGNTGNADQLSGEKGYAASVGEKRRMYEGVFWCDYEQITFSTRLTDLVAMFDAFVMAQSLDEMDYNDFMKNVNTASLPITKEDLRVRARRMRQSVMDQTAKLQMELDTMIAKSPTKEDTNSSSAKE